MKIVLAVLVLALLCRAAIAYYWYIDASERDLPLEKWE